MNKPRHIEFLPYRALNLIPEFFQGKSVTLLTVMSVCAFVLVNPSSVLATSISIDVDPGTVGIQDTLSVAAGDSFTVDIVADLMGNTLAGYEFDLDFDPAILSATSVTSGGFLTFSGFGAVINAENDIASPDVNFAESVLGTSTTTGEGVLASITFNTGAAGTSSLDLNDVLFFQPVLPFGAGPLNIDDVVNGSINVTGIGPGPGPGTAVPEPSTVLLMGVGLFGLCALKRKRAISKRN